MDTRQHEISASGRWLRSHPAAVPSSASQPQQQQHPQAPASSLFDVPAGYPTTLSAASHGKNASFADGAQNSASSSIQSSPIDPNDLHASQNARTTRRNRRSVFQNVPQEAPEQIQYASAEQTVSYSHHRQYQQQDGQFAVPSLPISAPASTSNFLPYGPESAFEEEVEPLSQSHSHSRSNSHLPNLVQTRGHARSASAASATHSHSSYGGGHLSASTSSASSSYGDSSTPSSLAFTSIAPGSAGPIPIQRGNRLTADDRRELCLYAERNPRWKHDSIGKLFGIERSTVSKILKDRARWVPESDDQGSNSGVNSPAGPSSPVMSAQSAGPASPSPLQLSSGTSRLRARTGRYPDLENALAEWGRNTTAAGIVVTDDQVRTQALALAKEMGHSKDTFKASAGWLENFKQRCGYRNGLFQLTVQTQNLPRLRTGTQINTGQEETERSQPIWPPASPGGSSSSAFFSPTGHKNNRRRAATGNSLGSSSTSLPGLAEEAGDADDDSYVQTYGSGSSGLRSQPSSATSSSSQLPPAMAPPLLTRNSSSFSAGTSSSANPSSEYSISMPQDEALKALRETRSSHLSTPTQNTLYTSYGSAASASSSSSSWDSPVSRLQRAQQAGLNFQLTLSSNTPMQDVADRQLAYANDIDLDGMERSDSQMTFESSAYPTGMVGESAKSDSEGSSNANYALRSRMQSAPHNTTVLRAPRVRHPTHPAPSGYQDEPVPSQDQLPYQQRLPLYRSHTDPTPILQTLQDQQDQLALEYQAMQQQEDETGVPQNVLQSTLHYAHHVTDGGTSMQIDFPHHHPPPHSSSLPQSSSSTSSSATAKPVPSFDAQHSHQQQAPPLHSHILPRRATISISSDATAYGGPSSYYGPELVVGAGRQQVMTPVFGHFGNVHNMGGSSTTSPSNDNNEKVSFEDAYAALRKVVGYLHSASNSGHISQSSNNNQIMATPAISHLAAPENLNALDSVLAQFREAHIARVHSLTPPSST